MKHIKVTIVAIVLFVPFCVLGQTYKNENAMAAQVSAYNYYKKGNLAKAAAEYRRALKYDPYNYKVHYNLGLIHVMNKQYPSAVNELEKAARGDSVVKKDALYNLIILYGKYLNDVDNAYRYYKKFKQIP
ncbi:MAG: tetratricopeptide repeat protein [Candidatus Omnitrophota bacterium]|nr:MAG: tetratricopeptide repeat protein [Candidatus Omnitrophota bacterium]